MPLVVPNSIDFGTAITAAEHEQNYDAIEAHVNTEVIHRDGSVAFTAVQAGVTPTATSHIATKGYVDTAVGGLSAVPVGAITMYGGATAPSGWLLCQGQTASRTTYAALYAVIGTEFGVGDGATTFNLPDFATRSPIGPGSAIAPTVGDTGGSAAPTLPTHSHGMDHDHASFTTAAGGAHTHTVASKENMAAGGAQGSAMESNTTGTDSTITTSSTTHTHSIDVPAYSGSTAQATNGDQARGNYHPVLAVNFIIRAT